MSLLLFCILMAITFFLLKCRIMDLSFVTSLFRCKKPTLTNDVLSFYWASPKFVFFFPVCFHFKNEFTCLLSCHFGLPFILMSMLTTFLQLQSLAETSFQQCKLAFFKVFYPFLLFHNMKFLTSCLVSQPFIISSFLPIMITYLKLNFCLCHSCPPLLSFFLFLYSLLHFSYTFRLREGVNSLWIHITLLYNLQKGRKEFVSDKPHSTCKTPCKPPFISSPLFIPSCFYSSSCPSPLYFPWWNSLGNKRSLTSTWILEIQTLFLGFK